MNKKVFWIVASSLTAIWLAVRVLAPWVQENEAGHSTKPITQLTEKAKSHDVEGITREITPFERIVEQEAPGNRKTGNRLEELNRDFFRADNAYDALTAIELMETAGYHDQAAILKSELVGTCPLGGMQPRAVVPEQEWTVEWRKSYCDSYEASDQDFANLTAWKQHEIESRAQGMLDHIKGMNNQQQSDFILNQVSNAHSWLDLEAIKFLIPISYNKARPTDRWSDIWALNLGQDSQYQAQSARDIQSSALTLLQCIEYIDCGSDSPFSVNQCYIQPYCESGWSLYDFLFYTHSPLESDQILQVLDMFLNLRRGG